MTRWAVPVYVTTTHTVVVDVPDGIGPVASASAAADRARLIPPEEVRRTMPVGTTVMVGTPDLAPTPLTPTEEAPA